MKIFSFVFIACILSFYNAVGQSTKLSSKKIDLAVVLPEDSNNQILENNPEIKEIIVNIINNSQTSYFVYFDKYGKSNPKKEFYDMSFKGDSLYFLEKYGKLLIHTPEFYLGSNVWNKTDSLYNQEIRAHIKMDSISYHYVRKSVKSPHSINKRIEVLGGVAKPRTSVSTIETKIAELYKNTNMCTADSIIVFKGIVSKEGYLKNLEQIIGMPSDFSKTVKKVLEESFPSWTPAQIRTSIQTQVRIYAELKWDGTITIETPKILATFSGN